MRASPTSSHIDDHRDVAPALGSLDDFDEMARTLHAAGIKVIVDIVPNHTHLRTKPQLEPDLAVTAPICDLVRTYA
jgi:maltooligosyltrehalose synthase